jgi:hypothetical protein
MADITSELAAKCGISAEQAQKGVGVVLGLIKRKLPAESFAKISAAVPGSDAMMAAADDAAEVGTQESAGVIGAVKEVAGKLFGGGTATALLGKLTQLGMTPDQVTGFLAHVTEYLKGKLPENVMSQIGGLLPTPQETTH